MQERLMYRCVDANGDTDDWRVMVPDLLINVHGRELIEVKTRVTLEKGDSYTMYNTKYEVINGVVYHSSDRDVVAMVVTSGSHVLHAFIPFDVVVKSLKESWQS